MRKRQIFLPYNVLLMHKLIKPFSVVILQAVPSCISAFQINFFFVVFYTSVNKELDSRIRMLDYYPRQKSVRMCIFTFSKEYITQRQKDDGQNIIHMKYDSMRCTEFVSPLKN